MELECQNTCHFQKPPMLSVWWNEEAVIGSRRTIAQTIPCLPGHHDGVGTDVERPKLLWWPWGGTWNHGRSRCFLSWGIKLQAMIFRKSGTATWDRHEIQDSFQSGWGPGGKGPGRAVKELGPPTWEPRKGTSLSKIVPNILTTHSKNLEDASNFIHI